MGVTKEQYRTDRRNGGKKGERTVIGFHFSSTAGRKEKA